MAFATKTEHIHITAMFMSQKNSVNNIENFAAGLTMIFNLMSKIQRMPTQQF